MSEPVMFISHFRIKEGALDAVRRMSIEVPRRLEADKPRTLVFLTFLDEEGTEVSFVHVFADREAMDSHFEGADERAQAAYEFIEPLGWEGRRVPRGGAAAVSTGRSRPGGAGRRRCRPTSARRRLRSRGFQQGGGCSGRRGLGVLEAVQGPC